jgi:hypothetical protein
MMYATTIDELDTSLCVYASLLLLSVREYDVSSLLPFIALPSLVTRSLLFPTFPPPPSFLCNYDAFSVFPFFTSFRRVQLPLSLLN